MRESRTIRSRHAAVTKAIAYLRNDWAWFTRFLANGRICLTNMTVERERSSVARGSKAGCSWVGTAAVNVL
ncbi:IS66 family transposase [Sphingomonas faeni]|uniref:IS66 family transposase n=1 Tax=Sphingomonas faeni TaxID=185950 RepID=UPI0027D8FE7B|nr:transposase [Sphingomonas faeni]